MSQTHNSHHLQQQHPDIYQRLFASSQIIVSVPLTIKRNPTGIESRDLIASLITATGYKVYAGRNTTISDQLFEESTITVYNVSAEVFQSHLLSQYYYGVIDTLRGYITEHTGQVGQIHMLVETTIGHRFGFTGSVSAALAGLISTIQGVRLTHEQLVTEATIIQNILKPNSPSNDRIIGCLNTKNTITYINPQDQTNYERQSYASQWGLQYGIINDGYIIPIDKAHKSLQQNTMRSDEYEHIMKESDLFSIRESLTMAYRGYVQWMYKIMYGYIVLGQDTLQSIGLLADVFDQLAGLLELCYGHNQFLDTIRHQINQHISSDMMFGIMPIYYGKYGGGYLFVTNLQQPSQIKETLTQIQSDYPHARLEYRSDGNELAGGLTIEQDVGKLIYSDYVEDGDHIYRDTNGAYDQGSFDELFSKYSQGILLDMINRKCFINGQKITSNQLKSQSTTAEVLYALLQQSDHTISNTELESSSYSNQQNQMLGKIILPLKRLTKEMFGEELIIECHGTLRHFDLTLQPTTITIGSITKVGM